MVVLGLFTDRHNKIYRNVMYCDKRVGTEELTRHTLHVWSWRPDV